VTSNAEQHLSTIAVTAGRPAPEPDAPFNPPIVFASTYAAGPEVGQGEMGYGRYGNPTWLALEQTIGALEGGRALAFGSGMAAAHAILELLPQGFTLVLPRNAYLGVIAAAEERATRYGGEIRRVEVADTAEVLTAARGADMVWLESPTNPTMEVADLSGVVAGLDGVPLVVDNTFATPLRQRPLELGAAVVMHSATKLLSGHSDALLGAVVVPEHDGGRFDALTATRKLHGAVPGTMESYLVLRGIRTLAVRLERAEANARTLVERLGGRSVVQRVRYPGFGSMLAVDLADGPTADAFVRATRLWVPATSLGGVESTLERRRRWPTELESVPEGLVRLSVGIEHVDDLWADLAHALDAVGG
jgi:cystathionine gamma-synthase